MEALEGEFTKGGGVPGFFRKGGLAHCCEAVATGHFSLLQVRGAAVMVLSATNPTTTSSPPFFVPKGVTPAVLSVWALAAAAVVGFEATELLAWHFDRGGTSVDGVLAGTVGAEVKSSGVREPVRMSKTVLAISRSDTTAVTQTNPARSEGSLTC